ncbi:extensin isoform X2 [Plutella xylostella]|uniref:extensin isoform X2 n=1 Tax=Plutella xylostella TaxID=51655 RepID=UPI0020322BE0|nr:extensin isoform X2 [Plutella xylostella]
MWRFILVLGLVAAAGSIRVPVDDDDNVKALSEKTERQPEAPVYYTSDEAKVDSYLVPPNTHAEAEEVTGQDVPATYLVPPRPDAGSDFISHEVEAEQQSDWTPILKTPAGPPVARPVPLRQLKLIPRVSDSGRAPKSVPVLIPLPASRLLPPQIQVGDFPPSADQQLPELSPKIPFRVQVPSSELELPYLRSSEESFANSPDDTDSTPEKPRLTLHLLPPKSQYKQPKTPTKKFYPKKFLGEFKPVPIPISQYMEVPNGRPPKQFKPTAEVPKNYFPVNEEKPSTEDDTDEPQSTSTENTNSSEQEASETNFRHPGRNSYPAPLRQAPPPAPRGAPPAPKERTEFRMHGMNGPHSYQFGYDTGKGKNRQFRFEERDNDGRVKGHYGYMDRGGKLRVVNYNADPDTGFHAEAPKEEE